MDIKFREIQLNEFDALFEIASKIWHDHYTEVIGKEQVNYMLDTIYDKKSLEDSTCKVKESVK
jgi:hypothetical protein